MVINLCVVVIAAAAVAAVIYLCRTLNKAHCLLAESRLAVQQLKEQLAELNQESVKLIRRSNEISENVHAKLQAADRLFSSVRELGDSASHMAFSLRQATEAIAVTIDRHFHADSEEKQQVSAADRAADWAKAAFRLLEKWPMRQKPNAYQDHTE